MTATLPASATVLGQLKGLDYFTANDEGRFEGRADAIERVSVGILQHRTFVLYGASGSGKTSLLLAGVIPNLERRGYTVIYVRTLSKPEDDLRSALLTADRSCPPSYSVHRIAARLSERAPVVLVLDQFEEFFWRFENESGWRDAFIQTLGELVADPTLELRAVFSLRQEWLGHLDDFRGALPDLFEGEYRLQLLTAFGARQAIARQFEAVDLDYEPRLLVRMVDKLEEYQFDPTILQVLCSELYRNATTREPGTKRLTLEDLQRIDIRATFRGLLDTFIKSSRDSLLSRVVLDTLTTSQGTKRAITVELLAKSGCRATEAELSTILEAMKSAGLVRGEPRLVSQPDQAPKTETWYELIHERLVNETKDWLASDRVFREFQASRDLLSSWVGMQTWRGNPEVFPTKDALQQTLSAFQDRLSLSPEAREFVTRGAMYRDPDSIDSWFQQVGGGIEDIEAAIGNPSPAVRRTALRAAACLKAKQLRDATAELALADPDGKVREVAADTLAEVGDPDTWNAIVNGLKKVEMRQAAHGALVRLAIAGVRPRGVGLLRRLLVRRAARRQLLDDSSQARKGAIRSGALRGIAAAIAWTLGAGFPAALLIKWSHGGWLFGVGGEWEDFVSNLGLVLLIAGGIGTTYGAILGFSVRRLRVVFPRAGWFRIMYQAGLDALLGLALLITFTAWADEGNTSLSLLLFLVSSALVVKLIILGTARLAELFRAHWIYVLPIRLMVTSLVPFFLFAGFAAVANADSPSSDWEAWVFPAGFISLLAFLTTTHQPIVATLVPIRHRRGGAILLSLIGFWLVGLVLLYGTHTLPIWPFRRQVVMGTSTVTLSGTLGMGVPQAAFYKLENRNPLAVYRVVTDNGLEIRFGQASRAVSPPAYGDVQLDTAYVTVPRGKYLLSLSRTYSTSGRKYRVTLEPSMVKEVVDSSEWRFLAVTLSAPQKGSESGGMLSGSLSGDLSRSHRYNAIEIRLLNDNPTSHRNPFSRGRVDFLLREPNQSIPIGSGTVSFGVGPQFGESSSVLGITEIQTLSIPVDQEGRWSLGVELRPADESPIPIRQSGRPDPSWDGNLILPIRLRPTTLDAHEYVENLVRRAETLEAQGDTTVAEGLGALLALARHYARTVPDQGYSLGRICEFGALSLSVVQVYKDCNDAIGKGNRDSRYELFRAVASAREGNLNRAADDLTRYRNRVSREDAAWRLEITGWIEQLHKGKMPFTRLALGKIAARPRRYVSAGVEGF